MSCPAFPFPASTNATLGTELAQNLFWSFNVHVTSLMLNDNQFLSSVFCASDTALRCYGICPNADLAGVGVRAAFWISSILQAILVAVSPEDSTQGAWTATILTASVTIPAFIQKRQRLLSVYHATLVLNFATFSSVVSLAVAPMCAIWRQHSNDDDNDSHFQCDVSPEIEVAIFGEEGRPVQEHLSSPMSNLPKRKVALQWAWSIILFTDPSYAQRACSPETVVLLFGKPFPVRKINHGLFFMWPLWLLFNVGLTLFWGILLVYSSSPSVHPVLSRSPSRMNMKTAFSTWQPSFPVDSGRIMVLLGNVLAFLVSVLFLVSSEVQVARNCVLGGENTSWGFGQIAAMLVALAPAWSIFAAMARNRRDHPPQAEDNENNFRKDRGTALPHTPGDGTKTPMEDTVAGSTSEEFLHGRNSSYVISP